MDAPKPEAIAELAKAVASATEGLRLAQVAVDAANSRRCNASNELNVAQRDLDAAIEALRKAAPRDSDWHSADHSRHIRVAALLLALLPLMASAAEEPAASVRAHAGYSAVMSSQADALPTAAVEVDAPVSLGHASVARVQAKLAALGIAGKTFDGADVRTFGSVEFELAIRRRIGSDYDGGATYLGVRGGGAALRDAKGDAPYQRTPIWWAVELTLERRNGDHFPHRWVSLGFGHSDISSPPRSAPSTLGAAARDNAPRDLIVSGSVQVKGPIGTSVIFSGDVHRGLWGKRATQQARMSTSATWGK